MAPGSAGLVAAGLFGLSAVGVSAVAVPFLSPALRRVCLPYVPATSSQIANVLQALSHCHPKKRILDLGSGDGRVVSLFSFFLLSCAVSVCSVGIVHILPV